MLRIKYPRTPHLPWSPGKTSDDLLIDQVDRFRDQEVVITEKMDGENTTMYRDYIHARSIDSSHHLSRDWVKQFHSSISYQIPEGWRLCGENLYARHSIEYKQLKSYFYLFSIWNEENICLSWQETVEWANLLNLALPQILYQGIWDVDKIKNLAIDSQTCEGYVVRTVKEFSYTDFSKHVAKWVRSGHVQTDTHWMLAEVVPNTLINPIN